MAPIDDFFREIDERWTTESAKRIALHVIGSTALMMRVAYARGTKDSDVLETAELAVPVRDRLLSLAGKDSVIHQRTRLYLDIVGNGIPFLPSDPRWHPVESLRHLRHFELAALDVVDVVVSKLKRFNANDQADVTAMVELGHDARAPELKKYVANLNQVERDLLDVAETDFTSELDALRY